MIFQQQKQFDFFVEVDFDQGWELPQGEESDQDREFTEPIDQEVDELDKVVDELWNLLEEGEGDSDSEQETDSFRKKLATWAVKRGIHHNALEDLMAILKEQPCGADLPKTARALLKTPRNVPVRTVEPGHYYHFGILEGVKSLM